MTVLPLGLVAAAVVLEHSGADLKLAAVFFDPQSRSWPFQNHWLFDRLIHGGGRQVNLIAGGLWLAAFMGALCHRPLKKFKKPLLYFLAATAAGPIIVGILKQTTHIYTPWDIQPFSGKLPYIRLFDPVPPSGLPPGHAFPSGHASGGFAWMSLYFLMHRLGVPGKRYGLMAGLVLGSVYGVGQQVRGAHFLSHDLFAVVICWYAAFWLYALFYPKQWRQLCHV